jgi:Ser-tRNA(Ala) deacylase AlaX
MLDVAEFSRAGQGVRRLRRIGTIKMGKAEKKQRDARAIMQF